MKVYSVLLVFASPLMERFLLVENVARGWELPGGHVEPGESPFEGARREWAEETGLPLARLQEIAVHERPDGSRGHLFLGAAHEEPGTALPQPIAARAPDDRIIDQRWVHRLQEVAPLAFPGDPYDSLADAALECAQASPWVLPPGESAEVFKTRICSHPEAKPRGDVVRTLPDRPF